MKKPPLSLQLKSVMIMCIIVFMGSSAFALQTSYSLASIMGAEESRSVDYLVWLALAGLFLLPLYSAHVFARILVRRSVIAARVFLMLMLMLQACAALLHWQELSTDLPWLLLGLMVWTLPMAWLFHALGPGKRTT